MEVKDVASKAGVGIQVLRNLVGDSEQNYVKCRL